MAKGTIKDTMALMDEFLGSFKKEAFEASAKQSNLGLEQSAEATAGGATAAEGAPRDTQDGSAMDTENEVAAVRMGSEESVEEKSEVIGKVEKEVVTENLVEKTARAERLGNAILNTIESIMNKEAAEANRRLTPEEVMLQKCAAQAAAFAQDCYESHLLGQIQRLQDEAELANAGIPKEALAKVGGIHGLLDKVAYEDPEAVLPEGMVPPEELPAEGAIPSNAELEQLAAELEAKGVTPEELEAAFGDVAPEEAAAEVAPELEQLAAELEAEGVTPEELEAAFGDVAPEEAAAEVAPEMAADAEGEIGEEELEALAEQLDEAGVTPDDLVSAFEDVKALQEAGVAPDELAAAVEEMLAEEAGAGAEEVPVEAPMAAEAPVVDPAAEAAVEEAAAEELPKEASALNRNRIATIKKYLTSK